MTNLKYSLIFILWLIVAIFIAMELHANNVKEVIYLSLPFILITRILYKHR